MLIFILHIVIISYIDYLCYNGFRLNTLLLTTQFLVNKTVDVKVIRQNCKSPPSRNFDQSTQTEYEFDYELKIKNEPIVPPPIIKKEEDFFDNNDVFTHSDLHSDNSEEELLIEIKKKKNDKDSNGVKTGRRKSKPKIDKSMLENIRLNVIQEDNVDLSLVKQEIEMKPPILSVETTDNASGEVFICCMCFTQCGSRTELLTHYRSFIYFF